MPYMKTTLISRPIEPAFAGIAQSLGFDYGAALGAGTAIIGGAINYYGQKNAASQAQAQAAAAARLAEAQAQAARGGGGGGGGGISTTYLLIGGAVLAGVLVFAMRRK